MSNYTKSVNFATKDGLTTGDPAKLIKGAEIDTEYNNVATASSTKANKISGGSPDNLVSMDSAGDIKNSAITTDGAGNITATITGSCDTFTTARTINGISFNGSANISTVPPYIGAINPTDTVMYPTLVGTNSTGVQTANTDGGLSYNASTNNLTTTTFTGALAGNATTAATLQTTRTINGVSFNGSANINVNTRVTGINNTDTTQYPMMALNNTASSNQAAYTDASLVWNGSTNTLTVPTFSGALSGNSTTATNFNSSRTFNATGGDVTGSASSSGGNYTVNLQIAANVVGATELVSTEEMTTTNVANKTASILVGTVGSYAFLLNIGPSVIRDGTTSFSNLRYSDSTANSGNLVTAGTWRAMGKGTTGLATLWLRIS